MKTRRVCGSGGGHVSVSGFWRLGNLKCAWKGQRPRVVPELQAEKLRDAICFVDPTTHDSGHEVGNGTYGGGFFLSFFFSGQFDIFWKKIKMTPRILQIIKKHIPFSKISKERPSIILFRKYPLSHVNVETNK